MSRSRLLPLVVSVGVLSACNPSPQYFETPASEYLWPKGETIGFKRKYKDIPALAGCIRKRIPSQYTVVFGLAPHGGVWALTLTQRGSKIVEALYTGNYMFPDGIVEIEWSRTRRPYDDVVVLTKAAEDPILGCTTLANVWQVYNSPNGGEEKEDSSGRPVAKSAIPSGQWNRRIARESAAFVKAIALNR